MEVVKRTLAYVTQAAFDRAMLYLALARRRHRVSWLGTVARWQDPGSV